MRQVLNLSQAKFAKEITISNGFIAGIELEKRNVKDRLIKLVCITFNVSEHYTIANTVLSMVLPCRLCAKKELQKTNIVTKKEKILCLIL